MANNLTSWMRGLFSVTGTALAGPTGALIGNLAGGLIACLVPGTHDFFGKVFSRIAADSLDKTGKALIGKLNPVEKKRINHDLQTAFRDAFREAIYDLGGERCFPQIWRQKPRDVPPGAIYLSTPTADKLWRDKNPLAESVCHCFQEMLNAVTDQRLLPLDPPVDQPAVSVRSYLETDTPQSLNEDFFDQTVVPFLHGFGTLRSELPDFEPSLRRYLLDRTLIHLGEMLKARTPAWRAYNRMMLEGLRDQIHQIDASQTEILERLDGLLVQPETTAMTQWSDSLADLLTATGRIEKQIDAGFEAVLHSLGEQQRETLSRFSLLLTASGRIEEKIERVLRILEDGRYVIEGVPSVAINEPPALGEPPFKGLQYFTESDADLFFGREILTAQLVAHLRLPPISSTPVSRENRPGDEGGSFLAVIGASGSGKSSVVRAGLIPALKRGESLANGDLPPATSSQWPIHVITPTAHPLQVLAASLTRDSESVTAAATLIDDMVRDPRSLHLHVLKLLSKEIKSPKGKGGKRSKTEQGSADHLLLVVDQFEELFTLCRDENERKAFIDNLLTAVHLSSIPDSETHPAPDPMYEESTPTLLVITLRADFYSQCARYDNLRQAIASYQEYIGPMSAAELRRAIEEPARRNDWLFEPSLVNLILRDLGADGTHPPEPGALPLLSHALLETWKHRRGRTMTLESYAESGGVRGAIAKTAETVFYQRLNPTQQAIAQNIFLRLTELGEGTPDTRRRASLAELAPRPENTAATEMVLQTLVDARLITLEEGYAEVSHEALIREWPTLRNWLDADREGLRLHHQLTEAAQDWNRLGKDTGAVYRGQRLALAIEWAEEHDDRLSSLEREFIEYSKFIVNRDANAKEEQRQRELASAQKLAEEAEARRKADADRARLAEETTTRLRTRNRIITAVGAVALLAAIFACLFGGVSIILKSQSDHNATVARQNQSTAEAANAESQRQSRISLSRELAARSTSFSNRTADLALLLAIEAVHISNDLDDPPIAEAHTALFRALQMANFTRVLRGHTEAIGLAVFNPEASLILTVSQDGTARLWDLQGNALLTFTDEARSVLSACFSPDGSLVLTTHNDGTARLWSTTQNGESQPSLIATLTGHSGMISWGSFNPDGTLIVTASADKTARVWKTDGTLVATLSGHTDMVTGAGFNPDGTRILTVSVDKTARLWNIDGTPIATLAGHTNWVGSASFNPDSSRIATAGWDGTARLWKADGTLIATCEGHTGAVYSAIFSPDGKLLLTAGDEGTARLWNADDGTLLAVLRGHSSPVLLAVFSPDGSKILTASSDATARLWRTADVGRLSQKGVSDIAAYAVLQGHTDSIYTALFSKDGTQIVTASADKTARLWQLDQLYEPIIQEQVAPLLWAGFSRDGKQVLTAGLDNTARLWNLDGMPVAVLKGHLAGITNADFSPDGQIIVTASRDKTARLWQTDGTLITELKGHTAPVRSANFSPDNQMIVTASEDKTARLWQTDGTPILTLEGHLDIVWWASFSPDGEQIVTASEDGTARVWNIDGTFIETIENDNIPVNMACFSPDGQMIAVAGRDGRVRLWQSPQSGANAGKLILTLVGHTQSVNWVSFSSDGTLMATASIDGTVRLWRAPQTGEVFEDTDSDKMYIATLEGHTNWVNSVNFSPDGKYLVTASWDSTARIWRIYGDMDAMLAEATQRVGRNLDPLECQWYLHQEQCPPLYTP
jgi:WD40 repeat protein